MHFDGTISLGNIIAAISFIVMSLFAWRDLDWRIKNMETWRREHMIDSDARDTLITKMDKVLDQLRWQTDYMLGKREKPPPTGF